VNRIIEVALSDNADLDAGVVANDAVIVAYPSRADLPQLPFWSLLFANVELRLVGSDDFPARPSARLPRPYGGSRSRRAQGQHRGPLQAPRKSPTLTTTSTRGAEAASWSPSPNDIPRDIARPGQRAACSVDFSMGVPSQLPCSLRA
jgi:hypothetical protein